MKKNHKRISAAVLSLALGFTIAGAPVLAPIASAQSVITAGDASTVNPREVVTLTINKYDSLPVADPDDLAGLPKIDAQFNFKPLPYDLTTLTGWQGLADFDPTAAASLALPTDFSLTTVGGTVTADTNTQPKLKVGAYLVVEEPQPGVIAADPFVLTLPFSDSVTGRWSYKQVVNPKNQTEIAVGKGVNDEGATLGSDLTYTITSPLPAGDLTSLVVSDDLPDELDTAQAVTVYTSIDGGVNRSGFTLTDSTIMENAGDGNELTVTFGTNDRASIAALRDANLSTFRLIIEFDAEVVSLPGLPGGSGTITNHAIVNAGGVEFSTDDPTNPDDGAQTHFGNLIINNIDNNTPANLITTGTASYELWRCQDNGAGGFNVITRLSAATDPADPASVTDIFTTLNGTVTLYGVQAIDWVNGQRPTPAIGEDICVVERQAPENYEINPEPTTAYNLNPGVDYHMQADVIHLLTDDVITLPETGGNGTMILIAAGVLVAAAGGAAAVRGNRARNK